MTTPAGYVITGYRRLSGGNWLVTVSVSPGRHITITVPAVEWGTRPLSTIVDHVISHLTQPYGVPPATGVGT